MLAIPPQRRGDDLHKSRNRERVKLNHGLLWRSREVARAAKNDHVYWKVNKQGVDLAIDTIRYFPNLTDRQVRLASRIMALPDEYFEDGPDLCA
jgi:hypothetical protein